MTAVSDLVIGHLASDGLDQRQQIADLEGEVSVLREIVSVLLEQRHADRLQHRCDVRTIATLRAEARAGERAA